MKYLVFMFSLIYSFDVFSSSGSNIGSENLIRGMVGIVLFIWWIYYIFECNLIQRMKDCCCRKYQRTLTTIKGSLHRKKIKLTGAGVILSFVVVPVLIVLTLASVSYFSSEFRGALNDFRFYSILRWVVTVTLLYEGFKWYEILEVRLTDLPYEGGVDFTKVPPWTNVIEFTNTLKILCFTGMLLLWVYQPIEPLKLELGTWLFFNVSSILFVLISHSMRLNSQNKVKGSSV